MECKRQTNLKRCNCSYGGCPKQGICCECLAYHLGMRQLPACCFPEDVERTYDRSFERFAAALNAENIPSGAGGQAKWHPTQVQRVLKRAG